MSVDSEVDKPFAKGDTVWLVNSEGGVFTYAFVEQETNYRGEPMMLLAYGTHPKQRNYHKAQDCYRSRQAACAAAAKTLRRRGEMFLERAGELEAEAAGIPWIPKGGQ